MSLLGGHGTAIAWAPRFARDYGIENAMEIGIACATLGLVLASLMGGPVARFLIRRHQLSCGPAGGPSERADTPADPRPVDFFSLLRTLFWLNMSLALGDLLHEALKAMGSNLPLFVCALFSAILLTNTVPRLIPRLIWPAQTRSLSLVSEISLGIFLTMSLMSLQLWTIAELAGPILMILAAQFLVAVLFAVMVVFPAMGANYDAAVICSGFGGSPWGPPPPQWRTWRR